MRRVLSEQQLRLYLDLAAGPSLPASDGDLAYYTAKVRREAFEEAAALVLTLHTTSLRAISDRILGLASRASQGAEHE